MCAEFVVFTAHPSIANRSQPGLARAGAFVTDECTPPAEATKGAQAAAAGGGEGGERGGGGGGGGGGGVVARERERERAQENDNNNHQASAHVS